jgi:hypothetical protein
MPLRLVEFFRQRRPGTVGFRHALLGFRRCQLELMRAL